MTDTYLGLYDDFQQAQRVSRDLHEQGVSLTDIAIISKRDDRNTYDKYRGHFEAPEHPYYLEQKAEHENEFITPLSIGLILGLATMGLVALITDTTLFGSRLSTLAFMLTFGAVTGAVLSTIFAAMAVFTRVRTTHEEDYKKAMLEGMTILAVRDSETTEADTVREIMSAHKPVEVTQGEAWVGTDWLQNIDATEEPSEGVSNNIAGQRYRGYEWGRTQRA